MIFAIIEAKYPANGTYPTLAARRVYADRLAMEQFKRDGCPSDRDCSASE